MIIIDLVIKVFVVWKKFVFNGFTVRVISSLFIFLINLQSKLVLVLGCCDEFVLWTFEFCCFRNLMLFWKKLNLLKMKQRISKKSLQSKKRNMNNFRLVTARALEMVKMTL